MTLEEVRAWLASPIASRYLVALDRAAETAVRAADRLGGRLSQFPPAAAANLRRLSAAVDSTQGDFTTEVNRITLGRARDGRAVVQAMRAFVTAQVRLEAETGRLEAFADANMAEGVSAVIAMGVAYQREMRRDLETALRDLQRWQSELRTAERQVRESETQRAINLALAGISLLISLTPQGRVATAVISVGGMALQTALDVYLGTGPDALGVSNTALGNLSGLPNAIRPGIVRNAVGRFTTGATALVGLHFDNNEVDDGRRTVARVATDMRRSLRQLERTMDRLSRWGVDLETANGMLERSVRQARSAARSVQTSEGEHRALMQALEDIE